MDILELNLYEQTGVRFSIGTVRIVIILKGCAKIILNEEMIDCSEDMVLITNMEDTLEIQNCILVAELHPSPAYIQSLNMNDYDCCSLNGENAIVKKFRLLIKQSVRDHLDPQTDLYRQSQTDIELLSFMCQHFSVPRTKEQDLSGKVRLYMLANAANPDCTLEKAAEEFGFSSVYFSRWFTQHFDLSFLKYLNRIRVENAANALSMKNGSILKIGLEAGFPNINSFNREFMRHYNCTPGEYRNKVRKTEQSAKLQKIWQHWHPHESGKEEQWYVNIEMDNTRSPFLKEFANGLMPLGTIQSLVKEKNISVIIESLKALRIKRVQLQFDLDLTALNQYRHAQTVFDLLIEQNIIPLITFEFRQYGNETCLNYIESILLYFANRYGKDYLENWSLEIEYNSAFDQGEARTYCAWIQRLQELLKKLGFKLPVYGPRFTPDRHGRNVKALLKEKPEIDGVTISCVPFTMEKVHGEWMVRRNTSPDYLAFQYQSCLQTAAEYGYSKVEITKWQDTLFTQSRLNDDACRAARTCQLLFNAYNKVPSLPTPVLLDSLVTSRKSLFSGQAGLICNSSILKPIYWLYSYWQHTDSYLLYYDEHLLITYDNEKYLQLICHNAKDPSWDYFGQYAANDQKTVAEYFLDQEKLHVQICLKGDFRGRYIMKTQILNEEVGNPYKAWCRMEAPDSFIARNEIRYLKGIAQPGIESKIIKTEEGVLMLDFVMDWNETRHIHLITYYE